VALVASGRRVYLPFFGAHERVDFVMEDELGLRRVQCKTAWQEGEILAFWTSSYTRGMHHDYRGEVDIFAAHWPERGDVYLVPVDDAPSRLCSLRLHPSRNGQMKGIRWAEDYRLKS
jgi:hypothetical protein